MKPVEQYHPPIRQLSAQLANQIAAGEVVERPASIVKELIENSLDAGASFIEIDIEKGGLELIRIIDNGHGIPKQELTLAVKAHCTSKISSFEDLTAVISMGFRGEALASIVSISRFDITSRTDNQDMAWTWSNQNTITVDSTDNLIPAAHPVGTSIIVRDIFYNTMARRKFLRSERTEFRYIEDVIKRIALSRFDVEIVLKHNQRTVHRLIPAVTPELKLKRVEKLLDKNFIHNALQVSYQASQLNMTGWLSNKDYSRGQTDMQYFYVNGRTIKDKVISHALRQVYQAVLPPGRFPAYVLNLEIDPQQVDVNVHPTKHEVRFRQMRLVHDFVNHVIQKSLENIQSSMSINLNESELTQSDVEYLTPVNCKISEQASSYNRLPISNMKSPLKYTGNDIQTHVDLKEQKNNLLGKAIGLCQPHYLISQSQLGMVLIHLLRVEQYQVEQQWLKQFENHSIEVKPFIFPLTVELDSQLCECIDRHQDNIQALGFDLSLQSKTSALLRAVPGFLNSCQHDNLIKQMLTSLQMEKEFQGDKLIQLLSRFVNFDQSIIKSLSEWDQYLRLLEKVLLSVCETTPYKNKFWRVLSFTEINKLFQANISVSLTDKLPTE